MISSRQKYGKIITDSTAVGFIGVTTREDGCLSIFFANKDLTRLFEYDFKNLKNRSPKNVFMGLLKKPSLGKLWGFIKAEMTLLNSLDITEDTILDYLDCPPKGKEIKFTSNTGIFNF